MMIEIISIDDIELSKISDEIHESYMTAVDFINSHPDYALLKFRNIAEYAVNLIASQYKDDFESTKLIDKIQYLFDCQLISQPLQVNLHEIRKLGNEGAHDNFFQVETQEKKELLIKKAHQARSTVISVLEDIYFIWHDKKIAIGTTKLTDLKQQENKEVIDKASLSYNPQNKLSAGVVYETMSKVEHQNKTPYCGKQYTPWQFKHLCQLALAFYESACELSADLEKHWGNDTSSLESVICKYADAEALYKYGSVVVRTDFVSESYYRIRGEQRLKAAADRGYDEAEYWYAWHLYAGRYADKEKKYKKALHYLSLSEKKDNVMALRLLFRVYTEGKACPIDHEKALAYLNRAIELGCPDSLAILGEQYYLGTVVDKQDRDKAQELLAQSVAKGSDTGQQYLYHIWQREQQEEIAKNNNKKPIRVNKIARNNRCPCGSGKKYKSCCENRKLVLNPNSMNKFI